MQMSNYETNPFQELYVTDSPDARAFVALFSSFPVRHSLALFRPGHVVLKGTQGSGKSMLLNLFRTQIRIAYHSARAQFPIPKNQRKFVGAGINLTRSGALDIGNRPISQNHEHDESLFPLYFADFLNYYIVRDILTSVDSMRATPDAFENVIRAQELDRFAANLSTSDCWFGALAACNTWDGLLRGIDARIGLYRAYHLYNIERLPESLEHTKTNIGEPISRAADLLRESDVIPADTPVYIRIDQVERLYRSDVLRPELGTQYRRIINKALGQRDSRVWYRIGTRHYAWDDDLRIYGTSDQLEHLRDFRVIDLDDMLRRKEDTKTWIFPEFGEDAFNRRLSHAALVTTTSGDMVKKVFGGAIDPVSAAKEYAGVTSPQRILKLDTFPKVWRTYLEKAFKDDPLDAMLAAAWARQRGPAGKKGDRLRRPPPKSSPPWQRPYWRKERVRQALAQIAARSAQRLKWSGREQILMLSAGNISIFLSICHEIWDAFLRSERRRPIEKRRDPIIDGIHPDVQAVAIQTASSHWYEKIVEQPKGDDRQRFINTVAAEFRTWLLEDDAMSYPGRNGFSLAVDELAQHPAVRSFLGELADYGDLYEVAHTTKDKDRKQRKKWYLSPIVSVYFQIPESHVKEPYYASIDKLVSWLKSAEIMLKGFNYQAGETWSKHKRKPSDDQPTLFEELKMRGKAK